MIRILQKNKKKNPHLEDIKDFIISNSVDFKKLKEGAEGEAFYFKLDKKLILNTEILQKGEYVLKIFHFYVKYTSEDLKKFQILSKYGLIPKIYVITKKYIIMKYIKGTNVYDLYKELKGNKNEILAIRDKVDYLSSIWEKLGFKEEHLDLNDENIIVSDDLKHVYLIDPLVGYYYEKGI